MPDPSNPAPPPPLEVLPRAAERYFDAAAEVSPVLVVMGARQTGKSTPRITLEVKATKRPSHRLAANITTFMEEYPDKCDGGLLLHCGTETQWIARNVLAAPWRKVA